MCKKKKCDTPCVQYNLHNLSRNKVRDRTEELERQEMRVNEGAPEYDSIAGVFSLLRWIQSPGDTIAFFSMMAILCLITCPLTASFAPALYFRCDLKTEPF